MTILGFSSLRQIRHDKSCLFDLPVFRSFFCVFSVVRVLFWFGRMLADFLMGRHDGRLHELAREIMRWMRLVVTGHLVLASSVFSAHSEIG